MSRLSFFLRCLSFGYSIFILQVAPPKKAALPSLEKKLKNAALVQESLKNLLLATEENTDQEGELLGAIVNWETTTHPRKRWKMA